MSFCRNVDKFKAQCRRLLQPHKRDWGRVIRSMALFSVLLHEIITICLFMK